jgi:nucleoside-diphosphate-sugar epimerase
MSSSTAPVLVTGGSGFIACTLVKALLEDGQTVHTTVRSLKNQEKTAPLRALQQSFPNKLQLFEADLLKPGSFDSSMVGCSIVHHVASPFRMPERISNGLKEMVEPALEGVRSVLGSVERTPTVRRVVLTSTVGAIFGTYIDVIEKMENQTLSEAYFNESSSVEHEPYHYSKVLAEKEAWKIYEAQSPKRWDLVSINPGLVLGPQITPSSESGSLFLLNELISGQLFFGVPDLSFLLVDIRDVVAAHCSAAKGSSARGRYIVSHDRTTTFLEMAQILRKQASGFRRLLIPNHTIPTWLLRIIGPLFGLDSRFIREHIGIRFSVDNKRCVSELGVKYTPLELTLQDHYQSWMVMRGK